MLIFSDVLYAFHPVYVYFQTKDDANWSDDKCVRFSEYATVAKDFSQTENVWQGTFLNMYLNEKWGRDSLHENMVTRLKFVLRAKEGKKVQGKLLYNFIRSDFDDRMSDNCGQYISAAKHYLSYTQDTELLKTSVCLRRIMRAEKYLMRHCLQR